MKKFIIFNKKTILLFLALNAVIVFSLIFFSSPNYRARSLNAIDNYYKEFVSEPIFSNGFINVSTIEYPHVQIPPYDLRYFYILFKENRDLKNNKYDKIFYANKRVAELLKWGNEIPVLGLYKPESVRFQIVKNAWNHHRLNTNNSWENILHRYYTAINDKEDYILNDLKLNRKNNLKELIMLAARLKTHRTDILLTIEASSKSITEKIYLQTLVNDLFKELNRKVVANLPTFDPLYIYFPLADIANEREFGTYDAIVGDIDIANSLYNSTRLTIGDNSYTPYNYSPEGKELTYSNIRIKGIYSAQALFKDPSLKVTTQNLAENLVWKEDAVRNVYRADFYDTQSSSKYYVKFKSPNKKAVTFRLKHLYTNVMNNQNEQGIALLLQRAVNLKYGNTSLFEEIIELTYLKDQSKHLRLEIESELPLTKKEISSLSIYVGRFYNPTITLRKVPAKTTGELKILRLNSILEHRIKFIFVNTSLTEENYILNSLRPFWSKSSDRQFYQGNKFIRNVELSYVPFDIAKLVLILLNALFALTFLYLYAYSNFRKIVIQTKDAFFYSISLLITKISIKARYLLLALAAILTIADIFFMFSYSDAVLVTILAIWLLTIIGFKKSKFILNFVALLIFTALPIVLLAGKVTVGEKLAIYAFTLLLMSGYFFMRNTKSIEADVIINYGGKMLSFLDIFASYVNYLVFTLYKYAKRLVYKAFNFNPESKLDYVLNAIKFFAILITLFGLLIISKTVLVQIEKNQQIIIDQQQRENLNPNIKIVEPHIAYQSNKVVIFGNNLGSKDDHNVKLISNNGLIETDEWTNQKIIFTIPLHWNTGHINIWIEKKSTWKNKLITVKSEVFDILLIPRNQQFSPDNDAYFHQLRELSDESLIINGYNPKDYE